MYNGYIDELMNIVTSSIGKLNTFLGARILDTLKYPFEEWCWSICEKSIIINKGSCVVL